MFARGKGSENSRTRTNQKIKFDIDISGKLMAVGDEVRQTFNASSKEIKQACLVWTDRKCVLV